MHELQMRESLERLAETDGGRRLLQLSLRSIEAGDHDLVSGCWTRKGDAGCLFQHAYWQGVADGVFADDGRARDWVSGVAGPQAFHRVIDVIAAFGRLARAEYAVGKRRFGPPELDQERWRERVTALLVEVLGGSGDRAAVGARPALTA
ncbi:MAG TPA: hypothetical protein VGL44_05370 [Gaiellales bacterium]